MNDQTKQDGDIKKAVLVYCKKCKPDIEPIVEDFRIFEVHHCPHVTVLNRLYNPSWQLLYKEQEVQKK